MNVVNIYGLQLTPSLLPATLPRKERTVILATTEYDTKVDIIPRVLRDWDMGPVKKYLALHGKYTPEELVGLEREYKRYLALCLRHPHVSLPMSRVVDPMWHCHILMTKDYRAMCTALGVGYIDHFPELDLSLRHLLQIAYEGHTLALYREHFGEPDQVYWPSGDDSDSPCADCGVGHQT